MLDDDDDDDDDGLEKPYFLWLVAIVVCSRRIP